MAGPLIGGRRKGLRKARKLGKKLAIGSVTEQVARKKKRKRVLGFKVGL